MSSKSKSKLKIRWDSKRSVAENAGEKLPEMARAFFEAGRAMEDGEPSFKKLHRLRLFTKRFRYTLEMFRPCYGPGLGVRIESLRAVQQDLGEINDCAATRELLLDRDDLSPAQRDWLLGNLQMLAGARIAKFRKHWREEFSSLEKERWWINYLERFSAPRRN